MKHSKRCESEHSRKLGFHLDEDLIPGICDKIAKHSVVSREAAKIGKHKKIIYRLCDDCFHAMSDAYGHLKLQDSNIVEGQIRSICPDCGNECETFESRLRFRENRL